MLHFLVEETEKAPPLTPDGNAALVDDFGGNKLHAVLQAKAANGEAKHNGQRHVAAHFAGAGKHAQTRRKPHRRSGR